jgi:predicted N-acetyltransferase YhbS
MRMSTALELEVIARDLLSPAQYDEVVALCVRAYEEPFDELMATFPDATHVIGSLEGRIVTHLLWVPRPLFYRDQTLRCAYLEAVATEPTLQGRGYASAVMRRAAAEISDFDIGGLSPSDPAFYERFGWELWHGPLALRTEDGDEPTPDEEVMILRLSRTPTLDLSEALATTWREGDIW